jgi:subtilisin family serine protease
MKKYVSLLLSGAFLFSMVAPPIAQADEQTPENIVQMSAKNRFSDEYVPDEVLVKFKEPKRNGFQMLASDNINFRIKNMERKKRLKTKEKLDKVNAALFEKKGKKKGEKIEDLIAELEKDPNVKWAQPNYIYTVNVKYIDEQIKHWNIGDGNDAGINADLVHSETTGNGVVVAVIDTGVDWDHPDLVNNHWTNTSESSCSNGVDDDGNGFIDDCHGFDFVGEDIYFPNPDNDPTDQYGHGTHVAGTIAAEDNNIGVLGVAPNAKLMALKVLDDEGRGTSASVIAGIDYARINKADIINLSLGGPGNDPLMKDAVDNATDDGILVVAAAGNSGNSNPYYPASYPNAFSVGAIDKAGNRASFSNTGPNLDIMAPGVDIISTYPVDLDGFEYAINSGTSMATPHIAGLAALYLEKNPSATPSEIRNAITGSATDLGASGRDDLYGYGAANAATLFATTPPPPTVSAGDIVINEIAWAGSSASTSDEWIELKNTTSETIDLSGFQITNSAGTESVMVTIPQGKSILANGYFLISNYAETDAKSVLNVTPDVVDTAVQINNSNIQFKLYSGDFKTATLIDTADDGNGIPFAGQNETPKKTMSRKATPGDGTLAANWFTSEVAGTGYDAGATQKGTPGEANIEATIGGGDITFAFTPTARNVAPNTDSVEFGILTIQNFGEAIELTDGLTLILDVDTSNNATATNFNTITDIRLVNTDTGATFMGPKDPVAETIPSSTSSSTQAITLTDNSIIETDETLFLSLQADVENDALDGVKYSFLLDMSAITVEGVVSGSGNEYFNIQPAVDPYTEDITIRSPAVTFTELPINNTNITKDASDVVVWKGILRANNVEDIRIRSFEFDNLGTADENDVDRYSFFKKEGGVIIPIETAVAPETGGKSVIFQNLDEDGTAGLIVPQGEEFEIIVTADISSNPTAGKTIALSLDVSEVDVEDEEGDEAVVSNTEDVSSGATFTLVDRGLLTVSLDEATIPPSTIQIAGTTDVPVGVFEFTATNENIEVKDITVHISEVDTTGILGTDQANDTDAIDLVSLFYYADGTAVKKTTGQSAVVPTIDNNGNVFFENLDLIIEDGTKTLVEVRVDLNEMDDNKSFATTKSGHTFTTSLLLDTETNLAKIRGVDSGDTLKDADITTDNDTTGTANDMTNASETMFVANNKVIAELATTQADSPISGPNAELLKFVLNSSGDNSDTPYLKEVIVNVNCSGPGTCGADVLRLYNDDNTEIASATAPTTGTKQNGVWTLDVASPDNIDGGSETYIIKGDVYSDNADNVLTTSININGNQPNTDADGITWKDGGSDGSNGLLFQWIDLGTSDESTAKIEWSREVNNLSPADTTPPVISNGSPSGKQPAGTTSVTLSVTTDENATCTYEDYYTDGTVSTQALFDTTGGRDHSTEYSSLEDGKAYSVNIKCTDEAGNTNASDYSISFSVAQDTTPPPAQDETLYEDGNSASDWRVYDSYPYFPVTPSVYAENGKIVTSGNGTGNLYGMFFPEPNTKQFIAEWEWELDTNQLQRLYFRVETDKGIKYLRYRPENKTCSGTGTYVYCGIGTQAANGQPQTFQRNLLIDMLTAQPTTTINAVSAVYIRGDSKIDNIKLIGDADDLPTIETYSISGQVTKDGAPLSNATIRFSHSTLSAPADVTTNTSGSYTQDGFIADETYTVSVEANGVEFSSDSVQVLVNGNKTVDFAGTTPIPSDDFTLYEDGNSANDWSIFDNSPNTPVTPSVATQNGMIHTESNGTLNGFALPFGAPNTEQFIAEWDWKLAANQLQRFYFRIVTNKGAKYIRYRPEFKNCSLTSSGAYIYCGVGPQVADGNTNTITRNLLEDAQEADPTLTITSVTDVYLRGSMDVDNIKLKDE